MSTTKQHITTETCKVSHGIGDWYLLLNPILIHIKLHIALTRVSGTRLERVETLPKSLQYFEKILKYGKKKC